MAHTKESLRELFEMAEEIHKYGAIDSALIKTVIVPEEVKKEQTEEERERFQRLLNTPYGL